MINGKALAIIVSLTDIGWGIGILLNICDGSLKPCFYWFTFAIFLLMVGVICIIVALFDDIKSSYYSYCKVYDVILEDSFLK